ncbi:MAG TPA: RNA polymerase sigma factor, partial [Abditibacteriaceae bacterium]|nr:RNA polymerase sigma factor [Abditibacteriaceae bacterium]
MLQDDRRLAQRIGRGEQRAFEEFLDGYGPRVHRLVRRYVVNESDAEDVTQEIFLDLYRSVSGFRGESSLATWVYRVALNHCLRYHERTRPITESYEDALHEPSDKRADPARYAAQRELSGQVQVALDELSHIHRDVVILHELH